MPMEYTDWITTKVALFQYQIEALNSKIDKLTEKVPEKEEKPKKNHGLSGYLLFCKEKHAEMEIRFGYVKSMVFIEIANNWNALTDEERQDWNSYADVLIESED